MAMRSGVDEGLGGVAKRALKAAQRMALTLALCACGTQASGVSTPLSGSDTLPGPADVIDEPREEPVDPADAARDPVDAARDPADVAEGRCVGDSHSTLEGARLVAWAPSCRVSRAALREGVTFGWWVEVDDSLEGVVVAPTPQDGGRCGRPDASGLIPFPDFQQGDERWCLCDVGLCVPVDVQGTLRAGRWEGRVQWDGRAWMGPSDFGNPVGEPFEAGAASFRVRAQGVRADATTFALHATVTFEIVEP